MSTMFTDHPSVYLPAYVLSALEPDQHKHVEEHLRWCALCRSEVLTLRQWLLRTDGEAPRAEVRIRLMSQINGNSADT
ncbi:MAG: hypothetical protein RLY87_1968 [Chloroflexota bacterium]|jgi:hypothetical protein